MPATVTVLYPNMDGLALNMDNYLNGHIPKVREMMGPYGLLSIRAVMLSSPPLSDGMGSGYALQVQLDWSSVEQFQHAFRMTSAELMADINTFSNTKPLIMTGDVVLDTKVET